MENLYISDEEIMISKSPFSAFEGEEKVYDGAKVQVNTDYIMYKVNKGDVTPNDFLIIEALNELGFATSRMVTQYLIFKGITEYSQLKVSNRLKFMSSINLITRFKFVTQEGKSINTRCYCLQKTAKYLLLTREIECTWQQSYNTKPLPLVKEILTRNQLLLSYALKVTAFNNYCINPTFKLVKSVKSFSPQLMLEFTQDNNNEVMLFEFVRGYKGYKERLLNKLEQYKEFYKYFTPNEKLKVIPKLILVGEDDKHAIDIAQLISENNITMDNSEILYTTDLRVLSNEINKSILRLTPKYDEGKITKVVGRILNVEILKGEV